jgi:hypothetical protein
MGETMTILLYALTALLLLVVIGAFIQIRHSHSHLSTSEWLEGMRKLDTVKPVASRIEGKAGVCYPLKKLKAKRKSLYVLGRKTGTEGGGRR